MHVGFPMTNSELANLRRRLEAAPQSEPDTVRCRRCGTDSPYGTDLCPICRLILPSNKLNLRHGLYGTAPLSSDLRDGDAAFRAGVISDRGGEDELTTLEHSYVEKLADINIAIQLLTRDISANGLITPSGRVRDSYEKLLAGLAAFDRYAMRLGLERRAKPVPSLGEVLDGDAE